MMSPNTAIDVRDELGEVHEHLVVLLRSLQPADWPRPVPDSAWTVRDVVAHLVDGDVRRLSAQRDGHQAPPSRPIAGYADLVGFLDQVNAEWLTAARRLSPRMLVELTETFGAPAAAWLQGLDPAAPAFFPVAWADQAESPNWLDVAREYTEKWLHQQQIRAAVGQPLLDRPRYLRPVLATFLHALPRAYRTVAAAPGTTVGVEIDGPAGGIWSIARGNDGWLLSAGPPAQAAAATVSLPQDSAWRLLGSRRRPAALVATVDLDGDQALARPFLDAVAVMA